MLRYSFWLLPLIVALAALPREAAYPQQTSGPTAQDAARAHAGSAHVNTPFGALSPEQAKTALDTLNDPRKRAAVAATLEAVVKGQSDPQPAAPAPAAPAAASDPAKSQGIAIQLAPDSLGAQVLLTASSFLSDTADEVSRAAKAVQSIPLLWGWAVVMVTNPLGQQLLAETGWRLAVVLGIALGVWIALRVLLRRPMARVLAAGQSPLSAHDEDPVSRAEQGATEPLPSRPGREGLGRRIGLGLMRFSLQMVPVLGLLVAGHMAVF